MGLPLNSWQAIPHRMVPRVVCLDLRGKKAVAQAQSIQLAEQVLRFALPWHLRELVDRRQEERRWMAIDLLVHQEHWETEESVHVDPVRDTRERGLD